MILSFKQVEELRAWAREKAPRFVPDNPMYRRRPVRLKIAAEDQWIDKHGVRFLTPVDRVVARAFLAEPRCHGGSIHFVTNCECGPLGERRLA